MKNIFTFTAVIFLIAVSSIVYASSGTFAVPMVMESSNFNTQYINSYMYLSNITQETIYIKFDPYNYDGTQFNNTANMYLRQYCESPYGDYTPGDELSIPANATCKIALICVNTTSATGNKIRGNITWETDDSSTSSFSSALIGVIVKEGRKDTSKNPAELYTPVDVLLNGGMPF